MTQDRLSVVHLAAPFELKRASDPTWGEQLLPSLWDELSNPNAGAVYTCGHCESAKKWKHGLVTARLVQTVEEFFRGSDPDRVTRTSPTIRPASAPLFVPLYCCSSRVQLSVVCAAARSARPIRPTAPPDVVLWSPSTRFARIASAHMAGAPRATPNLDRLARRGVTFIDATAHAPLTAPSHASILTGQYPPNTTSATTAGSCCRRDPDAGRNAARARLSHRRVRRLLRAESWYGLSRFRDLRRSLRHDRPTSVVAQPAASRSRDRARYRQMARDCAAAVLSLDALLRSARALRSAAGLRIAISRPSLRRRKSRRATGPWARCSARSSRRHRTRSSS